MIVATVLALLVTCFLLYIIRIIHGRRRYSHIKSPPLKGFLDIIPGHSNAFKKFQKQNPQSVHTDFVGKCFETVDDMTMVLHYYHSSEVWTIDVTKATIILSNNDKFKKPSLGNEVMGYFCGARFLGNHNLIFGPGDEIWQKKRKIMDAAFHRKSLKQTYEGMKVASNRLIENLRDIRKEEQVVDVYDCLIGATLEVITRTGFSIDEDTKESGIADGIDEIFQGVGRTFMGDLSFILPFYSRSVKNRIYQNIMLVREYLTKHLMKRIDNAEDMKTKDDILAHIIKANLSIDGFGVEEILDDFFSFFLAGMETTSSSMSFFLLMMVQHPDVCKKIRSEVDAVYDGEFELEYEDLNKLVYLEQCIRETMRVYAVAEDTYREALQSVTIDGLYLPKGTAINVNQSLIHRHPKYWGPDAHKFNPDNFGPNKTIKPFTYMPFMAGPRACIGKYFAMMEMKLMLSKVLLNFEFDNPNQPAGRLHCKSDITQRPAEGVPLILRLR